MRFRLPRTWSGPIVFLFCTVALGQAAQDAFIKSIAALPPDEQVRQVIVKLKMLNPEIDCIEQHKIEAGAVTELSFSTIGVTDISPLKALPWLRKLVIAPPKLEQKGALSDLSPLSGMQLTWLWCHNNPITDLAPLRGLPLGVLSISGTRVSDLTPLAGMKLQVLSLNDTVVADLSPVAGMPLSVLWCNNTRVTDYSPLRGIALRELRCDFVADRDTAVLRDIKTLAKLNNGSPQAILRSSPPAVTPASATTQPAPMAQKPQAPQPGLAGAQPQEADWSKAINLLEFVDVNKDAVHGSWTMADGALISGRSAIERIMIRYEVPDEYDYRIVFKRLSGNDTIAQYFSHKGLLIRWAIGSYANTVADFDKLPGKIITPVPKVAAWAEINRSCTCVLQVRRRSVKVIMDGKLITEVKTDYSGAGTSKAWELPDHKGLGLATNGSNVRFEKVDLIEISGKGKPVKRK